MPYTMLTPNDLMAMLAQEDRPEIWDLRIAEDRAAEPVAIPGARPVDYRHLPQVPSGEVILFCHRGLKISHGAAALLSERARVRVLDGGMGAWIAAGGAVVDLATNQVLWVTDDGYGFDRLLCLWILRGLLRARVLRVPAPHISGVAERFGARPCALEDGVSALAEAAGLVWSPLARVEAMAAAAGPEIDRGLSALHAQDPARAEAAMGALAELWLAAAQDAAP